MRTTSMKRIVYLFGNMTQREQPNGRLFMLSIRQRILLGGVLDAGLC
jgi:hypothetical protein